MIMVINIVSCEGTCEFAPVELHASSRGARILLVN